MSIKTKIKNNGHKENLTGVEQEAISYDQIIETNKRKLYRPFANSRRSSN